MLQLGNTLVFLFNVIGRNPEVQATLYEEARALAPPGCDISVEDVRKAKYLRACITEAFRSESTIDRTVLSLARIVASGAGASLRKFYSDIAREYTFSYV